MKKLRMRKAGSRILAVIISLGILFTGRVSYAYQDIGGEYTFDMNRTAIKQLEDLFTTIDIMDATIGDLTAEMEEGNVTSEQLNSYLEALMDEVYSIDYDLYKSKPTGRIELMNQAYLNAARVDTSDPYATYKAAEKLARAYDNVVELLKASGLKKLKTSFKVALSPKKIKAKSAKKQTVKVKVSKLTEGSSKPDFSIRRVTNGQKGKVRINKSTGKMTIGKKIKKCRIIVQVRSKANKTHKGLTKSLTIIVK